MLDLNDLLAKVGLDADQVAVMRHRPTEKALREELGWMAAERHEVYNAYQSAHSPRAEATLKKAKYLASFIGHEPGRALFVGLYEVAGFRSVLASEFSQLAHMQTLLDMGTRGLDEGASTLWFDLRQMPAMSEYKGRLVIAWPTPERAWCRWAGNGVFAIESIHEESALVRRMPAWHQVVLPYRRLQVLPMSWRVALGQWRGVYYIFDKRQQKGYVGSAAGSENLLGRWEDYAGTGHGGNRQLKSCHPDDLMFSVLQLVEPDRDINDVVALESAWKERLHTRQHGLNDN